MLAVGIASCFEDPRELASGIVLLFRSARHMSLDLNQLMRDTAALFPSPSADVLLGLLERSSTLQDIEAFGFVEGAGPYGFDYLPLLAEFGGPTPMKG